MSSPGRQFHPIGLAPANLLFLILLAACSSGETLAITPRPATDTPVPTATTTIVPPSPTPPGSGGLIAFSDGWIQVINPDGSQRHRLLGTHPDEQDNLMRDYFPVLSPDGTRLIFFVEDAFYIMDVDGSKQTQLTKGFKAGYDFVATWSPDGSMVAISYAYYSYPDANSERFIEVLDVDEKLRMYAVTPAIDPAWSWDGTQIAFAQGLEGNEDIYVSTTIFGGDSAKPAVLVSDPASDRQPAWSPDGDHIAFTTNRDGNNEIYAIDTDGSDLINLTNSDANEYRPVWSPAGTQIAYLSEQNGRTSIYVMNIDGSGVIQIFRDASKFHGPVWSPDGLMLAFISGSSVYIMKTDGSDTPRSIYVNPVLSGTDIFFGLSWSR